MSDHILASRDGCLLSPVGVQVSMYSLADTLVLCPQAKDNPFGYMNKQGGSATTCVRRQVSYTAAQVSSSTCQL